jgi:serine O-acetyltransferase
MCLREDIKNILDKDPAARSALEVILFFPGFHAITWHRNAHALWQTKNEFLRFIALCIAANVRFFTGIEIHPGAKVGHRVWIDHGMGVVIGETAEIGDDVVLYHGVTLGAGASARMGAASRDVKRHPTIMDGVVIGSGAQVLGDITVASGAQIASGSIVVKDVPENSVVVGVPGRVILQHGRRVKEEMPDIEAEAIKSLRDKLSKLEDKLDALNLGDKGQTLSATTIDNKSESQQEQPIGQEEDPVELFLHGAGI